MIDLIAVIEFVTFIYCMCLHITLGDRIIELQTRVDQLEKK